MVTHRAKKLLSVLLVVMGVCSTAYGQQWARAMFQETEHDFGTVARGAKAEYRFVLKNIYMEDVHIASVRSSCGCTKVSIEKPLLKTYEEGAIVARFNTAAFLGRKGATVTVTFDKPYYAEVQLHTRGYIRSDVVFEPGSVDLGTVEPGVAVEKAVRVNYSGRSDWKVVDVRSNNPHISARIEELQRTGGRVQYQLTVHFDGKLQPGYLREHLLLITNDARGNEVPLLVEGMVRPSLVVSPGTLFMGVMQPGARATKTLVIRGTRPFRVTSIRCEGGHIEYDAEKAKEPKLLHVIPLTFVAGNEPGKVVETIRIETDLDGASPELSAYAVVAER